MNIVLTEKDFPVLNDFLADIPARFKNSFVNWINTKTIENEVTIVPLLEPVKPEEKIPVLPPEVLGEDLP